MRTSLVEKPRVRGKRSDRFLSVINGAVDVAVVMHDNPDPDAIATGWAVKHLIEERVDKTTRLVAGGGIVRAENRHMVKLLKPPVDLVDDFAAGPQTAVILVDCGPEATNHLMAADSCRPVAVIDHHIPLVRARIPFADIRPRVAASATIAATYLREQSLRPKKELATGLLYAIRTETVGSETHYSRMDRAILPWLTQHADPSLLAQIESAPLPRDYFGDLVLALQNTFLYDDAVFCLLPRAQGPEIIGEVADLLVRCEGIRRVLCAAVCDADILLSVRTDKHGENAAALLHDTIAGLGRGGGHAHRAGGKLPMAATGDKMSEGLQEELRIRWLSACGIQRQRGTRLVARREIVGNL